MQTRWRSLNDTRNLWTTANYEASLNGIPKGEILIKVCNASLPATAVNLNVVRSLKFRPNPLHRQLSIRFRGLKRFPRMRFERENARGEIIW